MQETALQGDGHVGTATIDQESNLYGLICNVAHFAQIEQVDFVFFESSIVVVRLAQLDHKVIGVHIVRVQLDRHSLREIDV
jgi:hypothetical protein